MQIYGHRGAAGEVSENTIGGCLHALDRGVRRIEVDLQLSKDNKIVIVHDDTVDRTTDHSGKVKSFSAAELGRMDARFDGPGWGRKVEAGIPTLDALMEATAKLEQYQLEVKPAGRRIMREVAQQLATRFNRASDASRIIVTSQNGHILHYIAEFAEHLPRGLVATKTRDFRRAQDLGCTYFCCHFSLCKPAFVRKLQSAGLHVSVWTVNEPSMMKKLYKMGVDSIITDYPSMALPLLRTLEAQS